MTSRGKTLETPNPLTVEFIAVQEQTPHFQEQHTAYSGYPMNNEVPNTLQRQSEDGVRRGILRLISACFGFLICWPIGMCAIVMAIQAIIKYHMGDISGGDESSRNAKILVTISLIFGIVVFFVLLLMYSQK
uniref:Uncharacterized protein LOC111133668 isoform X2 n=1 Tax=Crassostrea virginica TaxID=6565 RepID=A0A8B8ECX3_CRAVI|nr:uncharacterized protein LOC111133668 isoform X2 [Crassostrea virginica]